MRTIFKNAFYCCLSFFPDNVAIHIVYFLKFKKIGDFKNPKTFNEKINWRKLYQRDPRFIQFADKLEAKKHVANLIGDKYIVRTLWHGESPYEIPFDELEPPYAIKTNHGSGDCIVVKDSSYKREDIVEHFVRANEKNYGAHSREWAYQGIPKQILVEQLIPGATDASLVDYKFFVFSGKVSFVQVDTDRFTGHKQSYFDTQWNRLKFRKSYPPCDPNPAPKLNVMIQLAEKIGELFDFVRVDFYNTPEGVFFGEVTFYPAGGYDPIVPHSCDLDIGKLWKM